MNEKYSRGPGIFLRFSFFYYLLLAQLIAEVVAQRVREPYGTLLLALAITFIEVTLIVLLMLAGGAEANTLAEYTFFLRL